MNAHRLMALLRKEMVEALRSGWVNIPITALLTCILLITKASKPPHTLPPEAARLLKEGVPLFIPLLSMPFYASTVLNRAIQTERMRGGMMPLMTYGGRPSEVWLGKVLASFVLGYVVMLLSAAGYIGYGAWRGQDVVPPVATLPHMLVTMPLAALTLIALQALLFWVMSRSALLSVILPLLVMFGGAQLVVVLGFIRISGALGVSSWIMSLLFVTAFGFIVERYPRDRAAGVAVV